MKPRLSALCGTINKLYKFFYYLAALLMAILLIVSFYVIIARTVFHFSPIWSDEVQRFLLVGTVFAAIPYLTCTKTLLVVNLSEIFFGKKKEFNRIMLLIGDFILLGVLIYLIFPCMQLAAKNMRTFSAALRIPMGYLYYMMPVSFAFSGIATIKNIVEQLVGLRGAGNAKEVR